MTTRKSWNDRLREAEESAAEKNAARPTCPECEAVLGRQIPLVRRGHSRWRCPACRLEWPAPVPTAEELPALKDCPRCARLGVKRKMIRVNGMWQWCAGNLEDGFAGCHFEEQILTPAQRARIDMTTRRAVGDCYGEPVLHPRFRGHGGGNRSRRRYKNDKRRAWRPRKPLDGGASAPVKHLKAVKRRPGGQSGRAGESTTGVDK